MTNKEYIQALEAKLKTAYLNASTPPENCADAKCILKGIRDDLKPVYEHIKNREKEALFKLATGDK